ncbi:MAG: tRNA guanosine(34) transglycosylase Tgt [Solirubrobacterales bacterium]
MAALTIEARDGASRARAGTLRTAHGDVRTPAFVPLATKATVKGLLGEEVAALGYEMVLGNTFHLLLNPGPELIERFGGLGPFMGWERPTITDSGGFQVFSMGHGTVADEIKGRAGRSGEIRAGPTLAGGGRDPGRRPGGREDRSGTGAILAIEEEGVRFRSYVDGRERFLSPEGSMAVQAALRSDIALVFDECTPFHVDRAYTERSTERTHRWLQRCLRWHAEQGPTLVAEHGTPGGVAEHGPPGQLVYGIVQGGVYEDLRRASARVVADSGCDGVAIGGSLGADKAQMYEVVGYATRELGGAREALPRHLLGIGEVDDLIAGVELGIDTFDCAMPTRLGRHGTALVPDPAGRWRLDLVKGRWREAEEPLLEGCPCPACAGGLSRAYLSYLARAGELTAMRLLTAHNLAFIARLMADLRGAILAGRLPEVAAALRAGAAPGETLVCIDE